jgi:predicted RNase H-like HicB family nuclease
MKINFTYWTEEDGKFLGHLNEYPDHWTQGEDLDDWVAYSTSMASP